MTDHIVNQPLTQISVFECNTCQKGVIRNDKIHHSYPCPFCGRLMIVLRTEWEERGTHAGDIAPT